MSKNQKDPAATYLTGENVINTIHAGGHARVDVTQSSVHKTDDENFEKLFDRIEKQIDARPEDPDVDKQEIRGQVEQIKAEAAQGDNANKKKLERWTRNLAGMAPDIVDVMVASLGGPISGATAVIQKIAAKVKAESESKE